MSSPGPQHQVPRTPPAAANRRLVWLGTTVALLGGAVLLLEPFEPPQLSPEPSSRGPGADLELDGAVIQQYREGGTIRYVLRAPHIEHFRGRAVTALTEPDLELYGEPDPPWRMTARRGTISNAEQLEGQAEEAVLLEEDVRMEQHYADGRAFELRTPSVTVYPHREYAETDRNVMITTHAGRTHAVGLQGDLDKGLLHLFSDAEQRVHTIVLPDQFR